MSIDKNKENSEENNKQNKEVDLKSKFIKEFTKTNLSGADKNDFIDEVMKNDSIAPSSFIEKKIQEFQAKNDKFNSFDEKKINIYDLKRAISKEYSTLENTRNNYLENTFLSFDLNESQKNKIESEIKKLSVYDLERLINSELENQKFLENKLKTKINILSKFNLGDILSTDEINKRLNKLSAEDRQNVELILDNLNNLRIRDADIRDLFATNFLNKKEKQELVSKYIPYIDLQKAYEIGLLTKIEAEREKEKILKNILESELSGSELDEAIKSASLSDVKIKSNNFNSEGNIDLITKNIGFNSLEKQSKEEIDEIKDQIQKDGPQNLEDLKILFGSSDFEGKIDNISNFKEGNIIKINTKTNEGKEIISYGRIENISDVNKDISISWIGDNATGTEIINLDSYSTPTKLSFVDFVNNFKGEKQASFLTQTDVQKLIESGNLESSELKVKDDPEFNKIELNKKLDEIDPEGKGIELQKGGFISTKDGLYKITGIDWETGEIHIESKGKKGIQKEKLTFESFYEAFKKNKATRVKPISNIDDFLKENQENSNKKEIWSNYIIKNGKLEIKQVPEYSKDKSPKIDFLVSDTSDDIFKIESIDGDKIIFRWGERKDIDSLEEKDKKKYSKNIKIGKDGKPEKKDGKLVYEGELLNLSKDTETMSLSEFNKLVNKEKKEFHPDWQTGKQKTVENPQDLQNTFGGSFMTRLFNNLSISEIIFGGKMMVENIEEYMKKGNDIHAAQVALKFGKMLPDEVYQDLKIKVERAENESTDKEIESLGKVDSWIAAKRIEGWLLNKDTPEFKKEAGLMFMIKKYGHLTAKTGLSGYKGKFLWYEAFGGKIGDKLFLDLQKEAEEKNQTFSEEYLMYVFVKKQCGKGGFGGISRRTRLHKEYKSSWPNAVEDEVKTGHTDASDERTATAMLDGGIGEMMGGTISNAIGWFEKSIERGGSLEDMSEGFFTLLYSGAIYNLDQKSYLKIKELWDAKGMPMVMARFSSLKSEMDLFNSTVLELSKRIGDEYPGDFPNIKTEALDLFNDSKNQNGSEKERLIRAQKFWKKYGTPLSRSLNMVHNSDNTYSKTDKIIYLESDKNSIFKEYYNSVRDFATQGTFKKDFMEDAMGEEGVGGLNTNQIVKQFLKLDQGGSFREGKSGGIIWKKIIGDINSIKTMELSELEKKKLLKHNLIDILSGFLSNHGGNESALKGLNKPTTEIGQVLNSWGVNMLRDLGASSASRIIAGDDDVFIEGIVDNILSGNTTISDNNNYINGLEPINNTKYKVDDIIEEAA